MIKNRIPLLFLLFSSFFFIRCSASLQDKGSNALYSGDYRIAVDYLTQETTQHPENADAWRDLGIAQYKLDRIDEAESSLLKAYNINKEDDATILNLGLVYEKKEEYDKAINIYRNYNNSGLFSVEPDIIEGRIALISRKQLEQEMKLAVLNEDSLKTEQVSDNTIAVLYFKNLSEDKTYDPLQKGLAEMLITDLSQVKELKIVERIQLQKLYDELNLSQSGMVDAESAPRVSRLLKANKLLKGSFLNMGEEVFKIDAGYVNSQDGSYSEVKNVTGSLEDYFRLQKDLVFNVVNEMGITLTEKEREAIQIIPTESYLAFVAYSKGLDLEDKGMYSEAAAQYQQAFSIDPSFSDAKTKQVDAENLNQANQDLNSYIIESSSMRDRLAEGQLSLTGEMVSGKDDRNPYNGAAFGRNIKVEIKITNPR